MKNGKIGPQGKPIRLEWANLMRWGPNSSSIYIKLFVNITRKSAGNSWLIYNWKGQSLHRSISHLTAAARFVPPWSVWELNCVVKWFSCIEVYLATYAGWNSQQPWNETILMNELIQKPVKWVSTRKTIVTKINSDGAAARWDQDGCPRSV